MAKEASALASRPTRSGSVETQGWPRYLPSLLSESRCHELRGRYANEVSRARSYQGVVDESVRNCRFVELPVNGLPEVNAITAVTGGVVQRPIMLYQYPEGVGFAVHHDEVTSLERRRALTNGQPVIGGDFTAVISLSAPEEYAGGELYFPDHEMSFRPPQGGGVVFPATKTFPHGVARIRSGSRHVAVVRVVVGP